TAFDERIDRRTRQVAVVVTGIGMAISHYSTAYFASTILVIGYVAYLPFRHGRRSTRSRRVLTIPVVAGVLVAVVAWNVVITRSAQNITNLATSVESNGLQLLPSSTGASLLSRFLNADVIPTVTPAQFVARVVPHLLRQDPWIHPYPAALTSRYPLAAVVVPATQRGVAPVYSNVANNVTAALNELLLLAIAVGILRLLWRERASPRRERSELAAVALGCLFLLGLLRLSATVSGLYNAPRGQVQGYPLLGVGLALVCSWLFRLRPPAAPALAGVVVACAGLMLFTDSGLSDLALGGAGADTLVNYGDAYQSYYFTDADVASATWIQQHVTGGTVVYTDSYGTIQLGQLGRQRAIVSSVIPQLLEPGAYVYATSTNVVDRTARATADGSTVTFRYPVAFLDRVKNVVYSTGTTEVFR
ncbi:MAG TPA: DUF2206 domain-containing protein, partial [Acidimicrobiales bacterium]|nr:DUF2206 domain-containing protein [Acidimicrobiales bacterium]